MAMFGFLVRLYMVRDKSLRATARAPWRAEPSVVLDPEKLLSLQGVSCVWAPASWVEVCLQWRRVIRGSSTRGRHSRGLSDHRLVHQTDQWGENR